MKSSKIPSVKISIDDQERCRKVIEGATSRELDILQATTNGLTSIQVAKLLGISLKTVEIYITRLRERCYKAWNLEKLPHGFLYVTFAAFFQYEMGNVEEEPDEGMISF